MDWPHPHQWQREGRGSSRPPGTILERPGSRMAMILTNHEERSHGKGGILAYQGAAGLFEGIGDLVDEAAAETGRETSPQTLEGAVQAAGMARPRRGGG
jgi:hypothetical protein